MADGAEPGRVVRVNYALAWTIFVAVVVFFASAVYNFADIKNRLSRLEELASGVDPSRAAMNSAIREGEIYDVQSAAEIKELTRRIERLEQREP